MTDIPRDRPGRFAERPSQIPPRGWLQVLRRVWDEFGEDNVSLISAGVAFYSFLAFVPMLAAVMLIYGLAADPLTVARHMQSLTEIMPRDVALLIGEQLEGMVEAQQSKKGLGLLLALLVSLYGAMRGADAMIVALTAVYDCVETRSFVRRTILQAALTVGAAVVVLSGIMGVAALAWIEAALPYSAPIVGVFFKLLLWTAAAIAASLGFAVVYRYAPDRPKARWRWITPGSVVATIVWLGGTGLFSLYVARFGDYNATYGSLGAVVAFLTWLYLSAYVILLGGELNSEIERQAKGSPTGGSE